MELSRQGRRTSYVTLLQVFREDTILSNTPGLWHLHQPGPRLAFHPQQPPLWWKGLLPVEMQMARGEAPGSVEHAWVSEAEDLSSRPDSALAGQAASAKWTNQLLHLQNGDNKVAI